jgi:hypothetical protein
MQMLRTSSVDIETTQCSRGTLLPESETCILVTPPRAPTARRGVATSKSKPKEGSRAPNAQDATTHGKTPPLGTPRIRRISEGSLLKKVIPPGVLVRSVAPSLPLPPSPPSPAATPAPSSPVAVTTAENVLPVSVPAASTGTPTVIIQREPPIGSMFLFLTGFAAGLAMCMLFASVRGHSSADVRYEACSAVAKVAGFRCTPK